MGTVVGTSVWTGRALQAESDDLEVIGLALLYPALQRCESCHRSAYTLRPVDPARRRPAPHGRHIGRHVLKQRSTRRRSIMAIKTIVLVHGAFADGSCWAKVIPLLTQRGVEASGGQNPLSSLADDVTAAHRVIGMQDGPVLLVGHSWGGAVITEAGNHPQVKGLVYVAAGAPDSGQSFDEWWKPYKPAPGAAEIRPYGEGYVAL